MSLKALSPSRRLTDAFARNPADNAWLDCLRVLAIALVILRHGQRVFETGHDASFWEAFKLNGWAGVDLFFVLSGYLVTAGLLRAFADEGCIKGMHYATKRIRRIVPAYVFVLALVILGYFPHFNVVGEDLTARVVYHLAFMQDVLPSDINVVFWSLGVEAKYYAVIPVFVLLASRVSRWPIILGFAFAAVLLGPALRWMIYASDEIQNYYVFWRTLRSPFFACLEPFALGFLVAVLEKRGVLCLSPKAASVLFMLSMVVLIFFLGSHVFLKEIGFWDATVQPFFLALIFAILIAAASQMKSIQTRYEPFFRYGARVSYSLYLVHFPLIPLSLVLANAYDLGAMGFWTLYIGISLIHAIIILCYIETPSMKPKELRLRSIQLRKMLSAARPM
jgi:peptidoglycan/LPS O-acetylase OafA/YrhL